MSVANAIFGKLLQAGVDLTGLTNVEFTNPVEFSGGIQSSTEHPFRIYSNEATLADDASFDLPDAKDGILLAFESGGEGGVAAIQSDGSVAILAGTTNFVGTDSDTDFCVFDGGTAATVRNRTGSEATVFAIFFHFV